MPSEVDAEEVVSRFIDEKKKFRADMTVKHNVFMPAKNLTISTYRIQTLQANEATIWEIAKEFVEPARQKPTIARADIKAGKIYDQGLRFDPNGVPHELHADVIDWDDDGAKNRSIALDLAAEASLKMRENS